jgi:hypothetical protein
VHRVDVGEGFELKVVGCKAKFHWLKGLKWAFAVGAMSVGAESN